jgi:hypothetical protein
MSILHSRIIISLPILCFMIIPFIISDDPTSKKIINNDITDLAIGNSHNTSINFESIGLNGHNGYIPGADVNQTIKSFWALHENHKKIKRVWISSSPGFIHYYKNASWLGRHGWATSYLDIFQDFNSKYIMFDLRIQKFWGSGRNALIDRKNKFFEIAANETNTPHIERILNPFELNKKIDRHLKIEKQTILFKNDQNIKRLDEFSEKLADLNITIIFFTQPYLKEFKDHELFHYFQKSQSIFESKIMTKHKNVYYFDFTDLFIPNNYHYYSDVSHLNIFGAKEFTPVLYRTFLKAFKKSNY